MATSFTDNIRKSMDKEQLTGAIFVDLRKGFGTIGHPLIISKLTDYGFN